MKEWTPGIDGPRPDLKKCPWCGTAPVMQRWHGGGPEKRMLGCDNLDCRLAPAVCGETPEEAIIHWENRADPALVNRTTATQ
jgi:hypothetical protein